MSASPKHPHRSEPTPFIAYMVFLILALCLLSAAAIMWGITQDKNWHGFAGHSFAAVRSVAGAPAWSEPVARR